VKDEHRQHIVTVTVSLHVERRAHKRGTGRQLAAASQTSEARVRILLVEDETSVSINTGMILEDEGFTVDYAYNGRDALAKIKASPPNLIITDYMMPHMDGLAMITTLRSDGWTGPVVLTTSIMEDRLPLSYPRGHDGYLAKPHREEDLLILVRALLTQTQHRA
jgi:DNA-binding response OmpR family regulator